MQLAYLKRHPLLAIQTAVVTASLAMLGSRTIRVWGLLWFEKLRLKYQSRKLKTPVPVNINRWRCREVDLHDQDVLWGEIAINNSWWDFLTVAWSNRGYTLYVMSNPRDIRNFVPSPVDGEPSPSEQIFPYGRRLYKKNKEAGLSWPCNVSLIRRIQRGPFNSCVTTKPQCRLLTAGFQDVVIRIVSNRSNPTIQILRYLSSPVVSKDPRNITIPIVDEQEIYGLIFVIMPRWDHAWLNDFATVTELMDAAEIFLQYLDFLHKHRIAHMDLHVANTAVNTVISTLAPGFQKGLRDPRDTHYAVFDFGESFMYPRDTPLDSVEEVLPGIGWGLRNVVVPNVPFNPFRVDVALMGYLLETRLRVLQDDIPEVVPFFDTMHDVDPLKRPTAHEALRQFQHIRANLTPEQLGVPVRGLRWHSIAGITLKPEYKKKKK